MSLLQQAPRFDLAGAARLARDMYGLDASASPLPSERDQNFLLATNAGDRYVLKVANATENRPMLEAQNAAMAHLADRVAFCPRVLPAITGDAIGIAPGSGHLVRLVTYLAGIPLAQAGARPTALLESLGRAVGRLDAALADFDHPAIHRNFHWGLANASRVIGEHLPLILDRAERQLVQRVSASALQATEARQPAFRCSAVHHDANDWNVLVSNLESRIANPEFRYHAAHALLDEELAAVFPLACLRLCMSVCIAAWQQQQRPGDEYLAVSQEPIRRTLPALAAIPLHMAAQTLRAACRVGSRA